MAAWEGEFCVTDVIAAEIIDQGYLRRKVL